MADYSKGKIYKLVSGSGLTYFGSTIQPLSKRKGGHKSHFIDYKNNKTNYTTSFKLFEEDTNNVDIVLVEEFPCENKEQLHKRERFYIDNNECVNKRIPSRTSKEYRETNKEKIKEQKKEYIDNNKGKIHEHQKEYYLQNKGKIQERCKQFRELNKEKLNEQHRKYYSNNKENIGQKITCECGLIIRKDGLKDHKRTKKHNDLLEKTDYFSENNIVI